MSDIFIGFLSRLCSGIKRDATRGRRVRNFSQQVIRSGSLARGWNSKIDREINRATLPLLVLSPSFRAYNPVSPVSRRERLNRNELARVYRRIHKRVHYSCTRIRI